MIQKLAHERLIVTDKPGETTDKKIAIEVAHEALIREWELLRQWLDQDRANLLQQRKIEALAQEWEKSGRKSAYLLVGFRLKEAIKFQKEQAWQYPLKKLGSDFIAKSVGKQRQNWLKLGVIPLIGVSVITFFGIRTYVVQSSWKIVQETQGEKYDVRRINALEDLVWWQESLARIPLKKANLSEIRLPKANLSNATLGDANLNYAYLEGAYLPDARLSDANLNYANLEGATLGQANLSNANLSNAKLYSADLRGAYLPDANLNYANLNYANLSSANLRGAYLSSAYLPDANLSSANLTNANLTNANLIDAKNLTNTQIKSACFWHKAIYKGHLQELDWITDEKSNQAFIAQRKQDKASDPKVKPDCGRWKK